MKNIEYYRNTKDALDAYVSAFRKGEIGDRPFDIWIEQEYVEPRLPTLLEAAEDALRAWDMRNEHSGLEWVKELVKDRMRQLSCAVKRERRKPVLDRDVYGTAEEAVDEFVGSTRKNKETGEVQWEKEAGRRPEMSGEKVDCSSGSQMTHDIKIDKSYADAIADGRKRFEVRRNDRGYNAGDCVCFTVTDGICKCYDHPIHDTTWRITYVHSGLGMEVGYVAFGIEPCHKKEIAE